MPSFILSSSRLQSCLCTLIPVEEWPVLGSVIIECAFHFVDACKWRGRKNVVLTLCCALKPRALVRRECKIKDRELDALLPPVEAPGHTIDATAGNSNASFLYERACDWPIMRLLHFHLFILVASALSNPLREIYGWRIELSVGLRAYALYVYCNRRR